MLISEPQRAISDFQVALISSDLDVTMPLDHGVGHMKKVKHFLSNEIPRHKDYGTLCGETVIRLQHTLCKDHGKVPLFEPSDS